jgi:hypothetical protein
MIGSTSMSSKYNRVSKKNLKKFKNKNKNIIGVAIVRRGFRNKIFVFS